MKKRTAKDERLEDQIRFLNGFGDLIASNKKPFRNEAEKAKVLKEHFSEAVEMFSRKYPGFRPGWFWRAIPQRRKVVGKSAYWSHAPARVMVTPIIETDSQFLRRTSLFFPHEADAVSKQAAADDREQKHALELWAPLVALARVAMGVHYVSDVVVGAALGIVVAVIGLQIHEPLFQWVVSIIGFPLW